MERSIKHITKHITKFLNEIDWLFDIHNFEREIVLKEKDEDNISAQIEYEETYQRITVSLYPCFWKQNVTQQRKILLHELCHCLTIPSKVLGYSLCEGELVTKEQIRVENERMTSRFENILDGLLRGKLKYARDAYQTYGDKQ